MRLLVTTLSLIPSIILAAPQLDDSFKNLENKYDGKIGIYTLNTDDKTNIKYNESYHFPICSVFKFLLVGAILDYDMHNQGFLDKKIPINQDDIGKLGYAPITAKNVGKTLTISQLNYAAILSDSPASNILVRELGGLQNLNKFIKKLGDNDTIITADEPEINYTQPHSNINKITPKAITKDIYKLAFGNILDKKHKDIFIKYLQDNNTGANRIAFGMPKDWIIGDKTGTCGQYAATNDVAIIWPKNQQPIALGILYTNPNDKNAPSNEEIIQQAAKLIANDLTNTYK
ncbi:FTU family class A beta-lactamase [Francisella tularensis]|uniref:Beta-lactamase n=7 Tax=Francisella tularensis TaxID=263 RepID=A0AAI8BHB6_FRATH|nr:FTU family class A beta-lactamase [Francisella tularensis]AFX70558.1 beta-lactamase [Francisella tularensis subsp. holarctica F92]EBA52467.1 beta-lactamase class A [Francisella tularensis subsp. holarctica 257]ABI82782.1 beta-lactamase [Francisella tularensis subsp. holarctica OSU18]ABU61405.1 beta-lactamase [Francisella tularensis subsp. holarctica FTNF002-00]AFT92715.1 beta-lactamase class A [Francisella tularensis subsp. holarctica FSC200]